MRNTFGLLRFVKPVPPPPPPVIDSYDVTTFTLKGKQFLRSQAVTVQVAVRGTITNSYGSRIYDYRSSPANLRQCDLASTVWNPY